MSIARGQYVERKAFTIDFSQGKSAPWRCGAVALWRVAHDCFVTNSDSTSYPTYLAARFKETSHWSESPIEPRRAAARSLRVRSLSAGLLLECPMQPSLVRQSRGTMRVAALVYADSALSFWTRHISLCASPSHAVVVKEHASRPLSPLPPSTVA